MEERKGTLWKRRKWKVQKNSANLEKKCMTSEKKKPYKFLSTENFVHLKILHILPVKNFCIALFPAEIQSIKVPVARERGGRRECKPSPRLRLSSSHNVSYLKLRARITSKRLEILKNVQLTKRSARYSASFQRFRKKWKATVFGKNVAK